MDGRHARSISAICIALRVLYAGGSNLCAKLLACRAISAFAELLVQSSTTMYEPEVLNLVVARYELHKSIPSGYFVRRVVTPHGRPLRINAFLWHPEVRMCGGLPA